MSTEGKHDTRYDTEPQTDLLQPGEKNYEELVNSDCPVSRPQQCLPTLESIFKDKY